MRGVFLEKTKNTDNKRKYTIKNILNDDNIINIYKNCLFAVYFFDKNIEIEYIQENIGYCEYFEYNVELEEILKYLKNLILKLSYYNNDKCAERSNELKLNSVLNSKLFEIVDFLKTYNFIILRINSARSDTFTITISLGYIELMIMSNIENYYYIIAIKPLTMKYPYDILYKYNEINKILYDNNNINFFQSNTEFYDKLTNIFDIYLNGNHRKSETIGIVD